MSGGGDGGGGATLSAGPRSSSSSSSSSSSTELKLSHAPSDGISRVRFGPSSSQFLLASSWDCTVRLYDVLNNTLRIKFSQAMPVLDCCFQDPIHAWSGGLDHTLKSFDINSGSETVVGAHEGPIRCVQFCPEVNAVVTGSWDSQVKVWDPRAGASGASAGGACTGTHQQPDKVYSMSLAGEKVVVGTANRKVWVWDLRNMGYVQQKRESSLKFQTRALECFPDRQGYVLSSIEGRVAVEYLDPSPEAQKRKYAFKCHRNKDSSGIEQIYPVNAVSFHRAHGTFATGGSDGLVNIWDGQHKKRLCQFHRYPTSIASLAFSNDGKVLAIASSYLHEQEKEPEGGKPEDAIYIRYVSDQETKPK